MSLGRGTGLHPDDPLQVASENVTSPVLGSLVRTAAFRPASVDWRHLLDQILDQGDTASCVGCAFSTSIYLRGQVTTPIPRPSAKAIYDVARLYAQRLTWPLQPMVDVGCRGWEAIAGAGRHGLVPWAAWPLVTEDPELLALRPTPETRWINTPPDFTLFSQAIDLVGTGHFRADTGDIEAALEGALVAKQFPAFGMYVNDDYGRVRGDEIFDVSDLTPPEGLPGHMQALCGYDADSFHVVSSWSEEHGNGGIVRVAKRVITSRWAFTRVVVTHSPGSL